MSAADSTVPASASPPPSAAPLRPRPRGLAALRDAGLQLPLRLVERAISAIAWARAPKEPPVPVGPPVLDPSLERPACPGCGATRARTLLSGVDDWIPSKRGQRFFVARCEVCALRYTTPRYRAGSKQIAYAGEYPFYERARRAEVEAADSREISDASELFERRARFVLEHHPRPGRLLDVGSGDGVFLDRMRRGGWDVSGVDFEPVVVRHARERLLVPATVADVERDPLPEGPFDAITIWGMLQLAYRPQRLLERLRERLAPGGVLAIGVSNFDGLGAKVFRGRWRGLGLPRHLVHFTPRALERMAGFAGYDVLGIAFETPRWITAGSVDAALPRVPAPARRVVRLYARAVGSAVGHTRLGDTMMLAARPRS